MSETASPSHLPGADVWRQLGWSTEIELAEDIRAVVLKSIVPEIRSVESGTLVWRKSFDSHSAWMCWHSFVGASASHVARLTVFIGPIGRFRARIRKEPLAPNEQSRLLIQRVVDTIEGRWLANTHEPTALRLCESAAAAFGKRNKTLRISEIAARGGWLCAVGPSTLTATVDSIEYAQTLDAALHEFAESIR